MVKSVLHEDLVFDDQIWKRRSPECKEFISSLLQKDPNLRFDVDMALKHPWISKHTDDLDLSTSVEALESVRESLMRYSENTSDFKRLALNVVAKRFSSDELYKVRDAFLRIDEGNDGHITSEEFKNAFRSNKTGTAFSDEEIESIFRKLVSTWYLSITILLIITEFVASFVRM